MVMDLLYALLAFGFVVSCLWLVYNVPIAAAGVRQLRKNRQKPSGGKIPEERLPTFSIVIPAKNEEKVIGRLLSALSTLNYPRDKVEARATLRCVLCRQWQYVLPVCVALSASS